MSIKINCDMGESFGIWKLGDDEKIMPHINLANLACGFHASDINTISNAVALASKNNVEIGAHPSYQDIINFGRKSIPHNKEEIINIILYQLGALNSFCLKHNTQISYVKPHGALYNDMMKNTEIFLGILFAIKTFNPKLKLMILSTPKNDYYKDIAKKFNIELLYEAFADRNYNIDGTLVARTNDNAVIHDTVEVKERIRLLKQFGYIKTINGEKLYIDVNTVCVHSDNVGALEFIKNIKEILDDEI